MPDGDAMDTVGTKEVKPASDLSNGAPVQVAQEEEPLNETERELTQTDHLNKSLLTSFLARLNDPNSALAFPGAPGGETDADQPAASAVLQQPPSNDRSLEESNGDASKSNETGGRDMGDWNDRHDDSVATMEK